MKLLITMIVLIVLFNLCKRPNFPDSYYRKAVKPIPWHKKIRPWWYFLNDDDPLSENPKFQAKWHKYPQWIQQIFWHWRNPLCNFRRYVTGSWDDQYLIDVDYPVYDRKIAIRLPRISFKVFGFEGGGGWKGNSEGPHVYFRKQQ